MDQLDNFLILLNENNRLNKTPGYLTNWFKLDTSNAPDPSLAIDGITFNPYLNIGLDDSKTLGKNSYTERINRNLGAEITITR